MNGHERPSTRILVDALRAAIRERTPDTLTIEARRVRIPKATRKSLV